VLKLVRVAMVCAACHAPQSQGGDAMDVPPSVARDAAVEPPTTSGPFTIAFVEFRRRSGPVSMPSGTPADEYDRTVQRIVFRVTNGSSQAPGMYEAWMTFRDDAGAIVVPEPVMASCDTACSHDARCASRCQKSHERQRTSMMGERFALRAHETRDLEMSGPIPEHAASAEMHITKAWEIVTSEDPAEMRRAALVYDEDAGD
jgi:hypothetical protein